MPKYTNIIALTGAGLSAESGIPTFRDAGGIWAQYDYRQVATPEGFAANPSLVHEFYNMRRAQHAMVKPNAAHRALARLEREHEGELLIVTQNVDALQEAAGSRKLIHMHGELLKAWCLHCNARAPWTGMLAVTTCCPSCEKPGGLRPDVVWFGEMPYQMERIERAIEDADLFISIGTSGNVYPAAGFVHLAQRAGAHTVELNLEASEGSRLFDERHHGPATIVVPAFVDRLLND